MCSLILRLSFLFLYRLFPDDDVLWRQSDCLQTKDKMSAKPSVKSDWQLPRVGGKLLSSCVSVKQLRAVKSFVNVDG